MVKAFGGGFFTCAAVMAIWAGAAIARGLAESPPQGINLSGEWQFNRALSDDADQIMAERRARLHERFERERRQHRSGSAPNDDLYDPPPFAPDKDFAQPFDVPVHITISQAGRQFLLKSTAANGDIDTEQYEAGSQSVTSFGTGYADRSVGWRDRSFVISLHAVDEDARKEERYSLDPNGRLVIATLLSGGELPKVEIKSVYDRYAKDQTAQ